MGSGAVTDWMLNRLCPKLTRINSICSNTYNFDPSNSFNLDPSSSINSQLIEAVSQEAKDAEEQVYRIGNWQKKLFFRKQSTLVEESINAMDMDNRHSVAANSPKIDSYEDPQILVEIEMVNLYNKNVCQCLSDSIDVNRDFNIPLKLKIDNDIPFYPYQYDQIFYQGDQSKDFDQFSFKILSNEIFQTDDAFNTIAKKSIIGDFNEVSRRSFVSYTSKSTNRMNSIDISIDEELDISQEFQEQDNLAHGIDLKDLDDEFDFNEIDMVEAENLDSKDDDKKQVDTVETTASVQTSSFLWGENNSSFTSFVSTLQISVALDGLSEQIILNQAKPIYSSIDLRELGEQKQLCAREKFAIYRKIVNKYQVKRKGDRTKLSKKFFAAEQMGASSVLHYAGRFYTSLITHAPCTVLEKLIHTTIYDLNAIYTLYTLKSYKGPNESQSRFNLHNPYLLRDMDGLSYLRPPIEFGEDGHSEVTGEMGESYKKWKRKMQILDKETRLALVNMGKSLEDIESTYVRMENRKVTDSLLEFYQMTQIFKSIAIGKICNHSFDDIYNSRYPYQGTFAETDLSVRPIMHCRIAMNLTGTLPISGRNAKIAMSRFHRPDFREGIFKAHLQYIRTGIDHSNLWGSWESSPLFESTVLSRYKQGDYDTGEVPLGMYLDDEKEDANFTHHPANYFLEEFDLSLADDCPFVVLEYVEQFPFYLSNPGMASRVSRYLPVDEKDTEPAPAAGSASDNPRNLNEPEASAAEAEAGSNEQASTSVCQVENNPVFSQFRNNSMLLGPLGMVHRRDGIDMFGVVRKIRYGMAIIENHLYRAPIFLHPLPGQTDAGANNPGGEISADNSCDAGERICCDFLLTRRSWEANGERKVSIFLRPLVPKVRSDSCGDYEGGVLYTVGQCEPKLEVPAPDSKVYYEDMKNLVKAWVLKYGTERPESSVDYKRLREDAKSTFCPHVPERDVIQIIKGIEGMKSSQMADVALQKPLKPEAVCLLESARVALHRLQFIGISSLQTVDRLACILPLIEKEERECDQREMGAKKFCRQLKSEYDKRVEALGLSSETTGGDESKFPLDFSVSLYGHVGSKHLSPLVRFVEETLKLTPWNITKDCKLVLSNKGSAQFMLYGFADPSGGRGEAINLLKKQNRDTSAFQTGAVAGTGEDLRKLSMPELRKRLLKYGVSDQVISSLPRWDQVALVRQYRSGFGIAGDDADDFKFRLAPGDYQNRINKILDKQHLALGVDDPVMEEHIDISSPPGAEKNLSKAISVELDEQVDSEMEGPSSKLVDELVDFVDESANFDGNNPSASEERELNILRQRKDIQDITRVEDKWSDANRFAAVPGIMWLRRSRNSSTEEFKNERAIFIYGRENIEKFLQWKKKREGMGRDRDRDRDYTRCHDDESSVVENKRLCRVCGQPGHIASNVRCPFYRGGKVRIERNRKGPLAYEIDEPEIAASLDALSETSLLDSASDLQGMLLDHSTPRAGIKTGGSASRPRGIRGLAQPFNLSASIESDEELKQASKQKKIHLKNIQARGIHSVEVYPASRGKMRGSEASQSEAPVKMPTVARIKLKSFNTPAKK